MRDKNYTAFNNLQALNNALRELNPPIDPIDLRSLEVPGANNLLLDRAIETADIVLYDNITQKEVLDDLKPVLERIINERDVVNYKYDPHGDKHFRGGPPGTKFTADKDTVNPLSIDLIRPQIGRIRRDANGRNQTYYLTAQKNAYSNGMDITVQVDFDFRSDTITFHGYPDKGVKKYVLSRTKGGEAIPQ